VVSSPLVLAEIPAVIPSGLCPMTCKMRFLLAAVMDLVITGDRLRALVLLLLALLLLTVPSMVSFASLSVYICNSDLPSSSGLVSSNERRDTDLLICSLILGVSCVVIIVPTIDAFGDLVDGVGVGGGGRQCTAVGMTPGLADASTSNSNTCPRESPMAMARPSGDQVRYVPPITASVA